LGEETRWAYDDGDHPHEANYLKLDCSKAHNILLWKPKWSLDQALIKIIEWYRDELTGKNVKEKTLSQINEYMKLEI
jgi:CDP-glucose 4,6-dehydratase